MSLFRECSARQMCEVCRVPKRGRACIDKRDPLDTADKGLAALVPDACSNLAPNKNHMIFDRFRKPMFV